jgi:hypothetical protein
VHTYLEMVFTHLDWVEEPSFTFSNLDHFLSFSLPPVVYASICKYILIGQVFFNNPVYCSFGMSFILVQDYINII